MAVSKTGSNIVKLWSNPNPTASFSPTNISINAAGYSFIFIETNQGCGLIGTGVSNNHTLYANYPGTWRSRVFYYHHDTDVMEIKEGKEGSSTDNGNIIPVAFYGVR